jgi:hypothetical protein
MTHSSVRAASLRATLAKPWFAWSAIALGVLLVTPSLSAGFFSDDYVFLSQLRAPAGQASLSRGPWDLMVFVPRDPGATQAMVDRGTLPWWTDLGVRIAFFRPLSSLSHALDHRLFADSPRACHVHSLLWFLAALIAAHLFFRALFGEAAVASLALLLFALDQNHGPTVSWIASRNTIMASTFAILSLWAHVRWRRKGWKPGAFLGPVFFALGLLSGEVALGAAGYLVSYALFMDHGPLSRRLCRLLGFALLVGLWAAAYCGLGYGASRTGNYIDPLHEPLAFLHQLAFRGPILLLSQLFMPWSDLWPIYPHIHPALPFVMWAFALLALGCMAAVAAPCLRRDRAARFLAAGSLAAVVPISAGLPSDRVLWLVGLGGLGLAAKVVHAFMLGDARASLGPIARPLTAISVALVLVVHGLGNLFWLPVRSRTTRSFAPVFDRADDSIPAGDDVRQKEVVLVNAPFEPMAWYTSFRREALGRARPQSLRVLASGDSAVTLTRIDERTLEVRPERGFLESVADVTCRSPRHPMPSGTVVSLSDVVIDVTRLTADERPAEVVFHFRASLEDPSFEWLRWDRHGFVPLELPAIGKTLTLAPVSFPQMFAVD